MNHRYQGSRTFQVFTIVLLSALCILLNFLTKINFHTTDLPRDKPEYNAQGVGGKVFNNKTGTLEYRLISDKAWQYPAQEKINLQDFVIYTYYESSDKIQYQLSARDGWVDNSKKLGFLGESTILTIDNSVPLEIIKIYTSDVNIDLNKNFLKSSAPVKATQNKNVVYATGFSYDRNKQFLTLDSKVRVIYEKSIK